MLPMPTHLENTLIPMGDKNNEFRVDGVIRCSCGYGCFHVKIYADTEKGYPQVCKYQDGYALVIRVVCMDCGKEYLVFDDSKHGWNGFICHDGVTVPEDKLKSWNCPKCSCDIHNVEVGIRSQGKEDFIDEIGIADGVTEFNESDWVNAFEWITIGLKCFNCGHDEEEWIDYETM